MLVYLIKAEGESVSFFGNKCTSEALLQQNVAKCLSTLRASSSIDWRIRVTSYDAEQFGSGFKRT